MFDPRKSIFDNYDINKMMKYQEEEKKISEMEAEVKEAVLKKEAIIAGKKLADTPPSKREELIDIMIKGKEDGRSDDTDKA